MHAYLKIKAFFAGLQAVLDMSLKAGPQVYRLDVQGPHYLLHLQDCFPQMTDHVRGSLDCQP